MQDATVVDHRLHILSIRAPYDSSTYAIRDTLTQNRHDTNHQPLPRRCCCCCPSYSSRGFRQATSLLLMLLYCPEISGQHRRRHEGLRRGGHQKYSTQYSHGFTWHRRLSQEDRYYHCACFGGSARTIFFTEQYGHLEGTERWPFSV